QLLLGTLGSVRQRFEQSQRCREIVNSLDIRRTPNGPLTRSLPVGNSLLYESSLRVMLCQQFRLRLDQVGKPCLQYLGNTLVILLPRALEQRLIGCVLDEGMFKHIGCLGWHAPLVEQLSLD